MTRKDFIKVCGILGIGIPLQSTITGCGDKDANNNFDGKVIIIGAGAGGIASGYLLNQQGIDFEILEASSTYGGRMKRTTDFVDFPIPLGAEWLHTDVGVFQEIVNDSSVNVDISTVGYNQNDTVGFWDGETLSVSELEDSDRKFVNSTWFDFFEEYIFPSISDKISFNTIVQSIDYSGEKITIKTQGGEFQTDKVIISVPLKILQDGDINFNPTLPDDKQEVIDEATIWEGFKAFIEFSEKFYHTATSFNISPETDGQKLYFDASYGQNTDMHILGLFVVGKPTLPYTSRSGDDLRDFILSELDEIYGNQATPSYIKHMTQNWNDEPFIKAGYLTDHADWQKVRKLSESIDDKIYFAGGPYTNGDDWVGVHAAAQSAKDAVQEVMK